MSRTESFSRGANAPADIVRAEIGWICQLLRYAAIAYAFWVLYVIAAFYGSVEAIDRVYGRMIDRDLTGLEAWQQAAAFAIAFVIWLATASACYCAWRLFSNYLHGNVFALDSALWLRRLAVFGVVAQVSDMLTRPLVSVILTLHFPPGQKSRIVNIFFQPTDMAILLLLVGLLALAHVQKTAADIAREHAQFV